MHEQWKPVVGYEGIYEVSDQGRVKRVADWVDGRRNRANAIRKDTRKSQNNCRVVLRKNGKAQELAVHRLVLAAFVGPREFGIEVNHKNGQKRDNRLENLEYVTHSENALHAFRVLHVPTRPGSKSPMAKVTEDDVIAMRALRKRGWTMKRLSQEFGLAAPTICWITLNKAWKHI